MANAAEAQHNAALEFANAAGATFGSCAGQRHGQHPLAHRQAREDVVGEVCRRLHHAPRVARVAHATAFAGEDHDVVVATITTAGTRKAVGEDAALQILAESLPHVGLWRVVVAPPVELA